MGRWVAAVAGCNAGVDLAAGRYYKTAQVEVTLVPATGCKNCTGVGAACCRDPTTTNSSAVGTCFAADSCEQIPVGSGSQGVMWATTAPPHP